MTIILSAVTNDGTPCTIHVNDLNELMRADLSEPIYVVIDDNLVPTYKGDVTFIGIAED